MRITIRHLKVFDNLALVPDMITGGHHVDPEIEQFFRQGRRDSEPCRGIFAIGNHQIDGVLLAEFRQPVLYDRSSRTAKNVTDKKNFQTQVPSVTCQISGITELIIESRSPTSDVITLKIASVVHSQVAIH